jgi:hypothetical protein
MLPAPLCPFLGCCRGWAAEVTGTSPRCNNPVTLARWGVPVVRIGLGIVVLWFGALKFVPDLSPAHDLATRTIERLSLGQP